MSILKTPAEYAALIRACYSREFHVDAVFEAAQAHKEIGAYYWRAVLEEIQKPLAVADDENIGSCS